MALAATTLACESTDNGGSGPDESAVIINEVAPSGAPNDWVELYNYGSEAVKLGGWRFTDVAASVGLDYAHGHVETGFNEFRALSGGVAAGDVNDDGFTDLYVVRGTIGPNLLFINQGDGTFIERGADAGARSDAVQGDDLAGSVGDHVREEPRDRAGDTG